MREDELLSRYQAGERNFSGAETQTLQDANLSKINLQGVNLSGFNLKGANLQGANLTQANLSRANLQNADLSNALLEQSNLADADLSYAQLVGASIRLANLNRVNLSHAYLLGADLEYATLCHANLQNANLQDAKLEDADLSDADLSGANLTGTKLFGANLTNTLNASGSASIFANSVDNPNLELLNSIRQASQGLLHISEYDYPYEVFLWEVARRGELTLEEVLRTFEHLGGLDWDEFCYEDINALEWLKPIANQTEVLKVDVFGNVQEVIQAFRILIEQLEPHVTNLQIYRLITHEDLLYTFYILMGNTQEGDWVGVSTKLNEGQQHYSSPIYQVEDMALTKPRNSELSVFLENVTAGIKFQADFLKHFVWDFAEQRERLLQNLLDKTGIFTIEELEDGFLRDEDDDEDYCQEQERAKKFPTLVKSNLTNLRIYRVGVVELYIYIVGQTENGDWIGIRTRATET
jgi:uncharacterized protein YjbI with pentapeptide repeats